MKIMTARMFLPSAFILTESGGRPNAEAWAPRDSPFVVAQHLPIPAGTRQPELTHYQPSGVLSPAKMPVNQRDRESRHVEVAAVNSFDKL